MLSAASTLQIVAAALLLLPTTFADIDANKARACENLGSSAFHLQLVQGPNCNPDIVGNYATIARYGYIDFGYTTPVFHDTWHLAGTNLSTGVADKVPAAGFAAGRTYSRRRPSGPGAPGSVFFDHGDPKDSSYLACAVAKNCSLTCSVMYQHVKSTYFYTTGNGLYLGDGSMDQSTYYPAYVNAVPLSSTTKAATTPPTPTPTG